jgi:DNA-binding MarR family transcriptional regulator/GNAT superfamily N-acetyltransferase
VDASSSAGRVDTVRRFNRLYTQTLGLLPEGHLNTPHSLAEARVLYELAHRTEPSAGEIAVDLRLDPGYMSRIVRRLEGHGLVVRQRSASDRRRSVLRLTNRGRETFSSLNQRAQSNVAAVLRPLSPARQVRLARALNSARQLLAGEPRQSGEIVLRGPRAGDLGWVVQRHGELYAAEYGWNDEFEALVARIVAAFVEHRDRSRERAWIAERDGERVGCVFLVGQSRRVAKLRLLLVDPAARGKGLGTRLVSECTAFATEAGYAKIVLWTQSMLAGARAIYAREGYTLTTTERHHSFGHDLVAETWELSLARAARVPSPAARRGLVPAKKRG